MRKWQELLALLEKGEKLHVSFSDGKNYTSPHVWTSETGGDFTMAQFKALKRRDLIKRAEDELWWRGTWVLIKTQEDK